MAGEVAPWSIVLSSSSLEPTSWGEEGFGILGLLYRTKSIGERGDPCGRPELTR